MLFWLTVTGLALLCSTFAIELHAASGSLSGRQLRGLGVFAPVAELNPPTAKRILVGEATEDDDIFLSSHQFSSQGWSKLLLNPLFVNDWNGKPLGLRSGWEKRGPDMCMLIAEREIRFIGRQNPGCEDALHLRGTKMPHILNLDGELKVLNVLEMGWGVLSDPQERSLLITRNLKLLLRGSGLLLSALNEFPSQATLPCCDSRINDYGNQRKKRYDKISITVGSLVFAVGLIFLYRVWRRVYFDLPANANAAVYVSFVLICAVFMWIGLALIAHGFNLV